MPARESAIKKAIEQYARAYRRLELLQRKEKGLPDCLIPIGDQKTGSIGEFWALLWLRRLNPDAEVTLSGQHNAPFDIVVKKRGRKAVRIQVKTVGPYNKGKVLSGIKRGHDELHVVELDETFRPARYNRIRRPVTGSGKKATSFEGGEALDSRLWNEQPVVEGARGGGMNDLYLMPNGDPSIEGYARKLMRRLEAQNMTSGSYVPHVPYRLLEGTRFGTMELSRDVPSGAEGYNFELSFRDKGRQMGKPDLADLLKALFHDCDEIAQQTQEPGRLVRYHRDDFEQVLADTPLADLVTDPYRPFFPPK